MLKLRYVHRLANAPHFAALRHRDYRNTWAAYMFSGASLWTFIVAGSWLVLDRSDSSGWVGIITFASMIPYLVVSPFGGLMADWFDRRNLALVTFVGGGLATGCFATLALAGVVELWHVAVLAFAGGVFRSIQEPTILSLVPNQVPKEDLLNAITLTSLTRSLGRFFGLLVAAPLLAVDFIGIPGVLVLSTAFQVLGTFQMARTRTVSRGESRPEEAGLRNIAAGLTEGLAYIYTHRVIALFVILVAFHCALVMSFDSMLPILSREDLGATDGSILGYLAMGIGVGGMAGTVLLAGVRSERLKGRLLLWTAVGSGVAPIVLAVSGTVPLAVLAGAAMGAAQFSFMALTVTYVQSVAPDRLRGRISSLYTLHAGGIMAFSNLGYGFIADAISAPLILIVAAVAFVAVFVGLSTGQSVLRQVYRTGQVAVV